MSVIPTASYLTEAEVLKRWPQLTRRELRRARKANPPKISCYAFPKSTGGPCYTPEQVQQYIDATYLKAVPCETAAAMSPMEPPVSRSADITSTGPTPTAAATGTPAGMTPELAMSAAEALKKQILSGPSSGSRRSSPRPRKLHAKDRLTLVAS